MSYKVYIDECGLGCGFSCMAAGAIVWKPDKIVECGDSRSKNSKNIKSFDSKKLSEKKRNLIATLLKQDCVAYSVQFVSAQTIDEINILQARFVAYKKCVEDIEESCLKQRIFISEIIVDGDKWKPYFSQVQNKFIPHTCVIKGDETCKEIGYASILCKTERDNYLYKMCEEDPQLDEKYGIKSNKGYFTKKHKEGIKIYGLHPEHRKTYKPCTVENTFENEFTMNS